MVSMLLALALGQEPSPLPMAMPVAITTLRVGYGVLAVTDARITVHFSARTDDGAVLADTERRGMAFTFLMDQETVEPFWHVAVRGMHAGGVRAFRVRASAAGLKIAGDPVLTVKVRVVNVAPL